ncbi:c-type cytochrome biogenesis protein CcsB [Aquabacterium fontiphilum]|uniref:c-type cytochrome biogenesis protein CcsB n=1 Tax=Aquabacterium fontiphilum TaxID=450365 RepID=UPI001377A44A|nr:c-type cytochrome biogenesis protein CcsB [Aquabacterium fontiphilum]NBD21101.1 c-type cytochrome biogenesis protein CcsB [Aquabacterium fontiphilum]
MSLSTSHPSAALAAPGRPRDLWDWLFALALVAVGGYTYALLHPHMDVYEKAILAGSVPSLIWLGWFWRPLRLLMVGVGAAAGLAIVLYRGTMDGHGADLVAGEQVFLLKYLLSSQSAILWMSLLLFMSTVFYWIGAVTGGRTATRLGSRMAWAGVFFGLVGSFVRWFESHQIAPDIGHIPVSNLYEVFVLFAWMTTAYWLYYEDRFARMGRDLGSLGAFVMLVVSASVGFLLWYALERGAHEIQPLVPALKSWWMKLHVPANFVGYGTFALAAMVAFAYLIKVRAQETSWVKLLPLWLLGVILCFEPLVFSARPGSESPISSYWAVYFGLSALIVAAIIMARKRIGQRLPDLAVLDDVMYKAIAVGFAFFTIATILGALWAAEAWGGYWSWDPKETWALIVWLNYAAWLHMRLVKGLRGEFAAWWALIGLLVTTFAFLGVNMFLSGLHSYGAL